MIPADLFAGGRPGALARYRLLAYIVGTLLVVLVCAGVPLQYLAGKPQVAIVVGTAHGFLFLVYLVAIVHLGAMCRFSLWRIGVVMACGLVPFFTFVAERNVTNTVRALGDAPVTGWFSRGTAAETPPR